MLIDVPALMRRGATFVADAELVSVPLNDGFPVAAINFSGVSNCTDLSD